MGGVSAMNAARTQEEREEESRLVSVLSYLLTEITTKNDKVPLEPRAVSRFHSLGPPPVSVRSYLDRIHRYANCSPSCFVIALIYIDRLLQRNRSMFLTTLNAHRLLITSVMLAAKAHDDFYYNNAYYAAIGGISNAEMNTLELEFLFRINFALFVAPEDFERYFHELSLHAHATPSLGVELKLRRMNLSNMSPPASPSPLASPRPRERMGAEAFAENHTSCLVGPAPAKAQSVAQQHAFAERAAAPGGALDGPVAWQGTVPPKPGLVYDPAVVYEAVCPHSNLPMAPHAHQQAAPVSAPAYVGARPAAPAAESVPMLPHERPARETATAVLASSYAQVVARSCAYVDPSEGGQVMRTDLAALARSCNDMEARETCHTARATSRPGPNAYAVRVGSF